MDSTSVSSQETLIDTKESGNPIPTTPLKSLVSLAVPDLFTFARRSSPRADEASKKVTNQKPETTRQRLLPHSSVDDAVQLLRSSTRIVILSGAGISTSVGIPDFRSDKGLYRKLSQDLGIEEPEDFFSNSYFQANPAQFFQYVKAVLPRAVAGPDGSYKASDPSSAVKADSSASVPKYSPTHAFLAMLQAKGKLLTNYTQNIDGLELAAGLRNTNFIQCHGAWDTATCLTCGKRVSARKYLPIVFQGNVPYCKCSMQDNSSDQRPEKRSKKAPKKSGRKRKRQASEDWGSDHSSDAYDNIVAPRGLLKPDITFFEDPITEAYKDRLDSDKTVVDLLIVVGTSLKVAPIQQMLYQIPPHVPQIHISKTRFSGSLCSLPGVQVDIELLGEADAIIGELCRRAGWSEQLASHLWEKGQTKIKACPSNDVDDYGIPTKRIKAEHPSGSTETPRHQKSDEAGRASDHTKQIMNGPPPIRGKCTNPQPPNRIPAPTTAPATNVKVELVEGTMHQWRVTRLS